MVKGEGMPQYRNPFDKGDLYVKFDVQFPENNWIDAEKLNVSYPQDMLVPYNIYIYPFLCACERFQRSPLLISFRSRLVGAGVFAACSSGGSRDHSGCGGSGTDRL